MQSNPRFSLPLGPSPWLRLCLALRSLSWGCVRKSHTQTCGSSLSPPRLLLLKERIMELATLPFILDGQRLAPSIRPPGSCLQRHHQGETVQCSVGGNRSRAGHCHDRRNISPDPPPPPPVPQLVLLDSSAGHCRPVDFAQKQGGHHPASWGS